MRGDHEWLEVAVPIAAFGGWLAVIAWASVTFGAVGLFAAWIGLPIVALGGLYALGELRHARAVRWHDRAAARRRHPAGSAGEHRSWG